MPGRGLRPEQLTREQALEQAKAFAGAKRDAYCRPAADRRPRAPFPAISDVQTAGAGALRPPRRVGPRNGPKSGFERFFSAEIGVSQIQKVTVLQWFLDGAG